MFARLHNQSPLLTIMVCLSVSVLLSVCTFNLHCINLIVCLSIYLCLFSCLYPCCLFICLCCVSICASVLLSACPPVCLCVCLFNCICFPNCISVIPSLTLHIFHSDSYFSKFVLTGEICSNFMSWSCKHLLWYQGCSGFWVFGLQDYWSFRGVTQYVRIFVVVSNLCIQFFQQYGAILR